MSNRVIWQFRNMRVVRINDDDSFALEVIEKNMMGESYWKLESTIGSNGQDFWKDRLLMVLLRDIARGKSRNEKENDHEAMGKEQHG